MDLPEGQTQDRTLVSRIRDGDPEAFAVLVARYGEFLCQVVQARVRRPEVAEEVVQEVWCKAYQKLSTLADDALVSHWLARMAANTAVQWRRRQQAWQRVATRGWMVPVGAAPLLPDQVLEARQTRAQVQAALARLSPADWQVTVLYYLEGYNCQQISQALGVTRDAVKSRLYHARSRLRQQLGGFIRGPAVVD
jgi:RNA polymerase sigma-70 factor (ECF subfamily)